MKNVLILLFASLLTYAAQGSTPVIVRLNGGGFLPESWSRSMKCEIYLNEVVITRKYGKDVTLVSRQPIYLSETVNEMVLKAAQEEVTSTANNMCDGPTTSTYAFGRLGDGSVKRVYLFDRGGCGTPEQKREGGNSFLLMDMANAFCPEPF